MQLSQHWGYLETLHEKNIEKKKEMWTYHRFWSVLHLGLWDNFWRMSLSSEH
jgi:hypothetical protein